MADYIEIWTFNGAAFYRIMSEASHILVLHSVEVNCSKVWSLNFSLTRSRTTAVTIKTWFSFARICHFCALECPLLDPLPLHTFQFNIDVGFRVQVRVLIFALHQARLRYFTLCIVKTLVQHLDTLHALQVHRQGVVWVGVRCSEPNSCCRVWQVQQHISTLLVIWVNWFVDVAWTKSWWVLLALLSRLDVSRGFCVHVISIVCIGNHLFSVKHLFDSVLWADCKPESFGALLASLHCLQLLVVLP